MHRSPLQIECVETPSLPFSHTKSAGGVIEARPALQEAGSGTSPTPPFQSLVIRPIPFLTAKSLLERNHYLHSLPGNTQLAFGLFVGSSLLVANTLRRNPYGRHR